MRRLTVVQLLPALESGGVERSTLEIAEALVQGGHRALVVSAGGRATNARHQTADVVTRQHVDRVDLIESEKFAETRHRGRHRLFVMARKAQPAACTTRRDTKPTWRRTRRIR